MHWPTQTDFQRCRQELDEAVVALEQLRRRIEQPGQRVMMSDVLPLREFIVSADLWSRVMQQLLAEIQGEAVRWASWQTPATTYERPGLRRLEGDELAAAQEKLGLPVAATAEAAS